MIFGRARVWPRVLLTAAVLGFLGLGAYWFKTQAGVNLFPHFALSDVLPFVKAFKPDYRDWRPPAETGPLIADRFAWPWLSSVRTRFWSRRPGTVERDFKRMPGFGPVVLTVRNHGLADWAVTYRRIFRVEPGQRYRYIGRVRTEPGCTVNVSLVLFRPDRSILDWHYALRSSGAANQWTDLGTEFAVPGGAAGMQFRVTGWGSGTTWLAGVRLEHAGPRAE